MKKLSGAEIRQMWLDFFASKGHYIEPGASLVPHNDPTLLWINSGVAALKKYFDGSEISKHNRITNAQKSIRTNDIDNVGRTARHHTFFEMLGNFSIGDYFRDEVITWACELLFDPKWFGFDKDLIYITYHPSDLQTKELWMKNGVKEDHLIPLEHNFWEIGEGPCGPNTEMFFDRGEAYDENHLGIKLLQDDLDNDRYIEIWNIVFSQYNAEAGVKREDYKELPRKNIDTGAGLERIACVLQETETNFETDLFYPYILATQKLAKYPYEGEYKMAYKVIADHIRTCTFALADGATFSNEGRGYVLRRILRRAVRYGRKLGIEKPFLSELVPTVSEVMKAYYPYLEEKKDHVMKMIKNEEVKFASTLNSGEAMLQKMMKNTDKVFKGEDAFKLYDTYGFPVELTIETLNDANLTLDLDGFNQCMKEQKERARNSRADMQSMNKQSEDLLNFETPSVFTYGHEPIKATVIGLFKDGHKVETLDEEGEVVFDKTIFYATSGGQVADVGEIENESTLAEVNTVNKSVHKQHLHSVLVKYGTLHVGDVFELRIDQTRRKKIMKNHSAAHLLQKALQMILGNHVHQEGSFVSDEYLRFDFSHYEKVNSSQINAIEKSVNEMIAQGLDTKISIMSLEDAKKTGAMALFNEKYGDEVRVVEFGDVSKELCAGTHVSNTAEIGNFAIVFEEAIASGIRRIEAKTSLAAYEVMKQKESTLAQVQALVKAGSYNETLTRIKSLNDEVLTLKKNRSELALELANLKAKNLTDAFVEKNGIKYLLAKVDNMDKTMFSNLFDQLKVKHENSVVLLMNVLEDKISLIAGVSKSLIPNVKAGKLIKTAAAILNGSGGGRDDVAQGGGKDSSKIDEVFKAVEKEIIG